MLGGEVWIKSSTFGVVGAWIIVEAMDRITSYREIVQSEKMRGSISKLSSMAKCKG